MTSYAVGVLVCSCYDYALNVILSGGEAELHAGDVSFAEAFCSRVSNSK